MPKITQNAARSKAIKPHPDYPLTPHPSGRWCKKIRQKLHYFGRLDDPDAALRKWLEQKDDLLSGRTPRANRDGYTVRNLANAFLTAKRRMVTTAELSERTFADYYATCGRLVHAFGDRPVDDLAADDFERFRERLGKTWGPVSIGNEVNRCRVVFRYGYEAGLLERSVRYGPGFKRPSRKTLRLARAAKGPRLFDAKQLQAFVDAAPIPLRAMVLLGINAGLGNSDCGNLEFRHLDLDQGWLNYPRPKTGIPRRCPLWPETVRAIHEAIAKRPGPRGETNLELVFITKYGDSWTKRIADSPVTKETDKLLHKLKIKRPGLSFYALRHSFETVAGDSKDQAAVDYIMGHAPPTSDMGAVYRERIDDSRLLAVSDHVRRWLFPKTSGGRKSKPR
jgi:integrase